MNRRPDIKELQEMRKVREQFLASQSTASHVSAPVFSTKENAKQNMVLSRKPSKAGLPDDYFPTVAELQGYLKKWDTLNVYVEHEAALEMLFRHDPVFRLNKDLRHIIVKCAVLNDFYATNIFQIEPVARNIASIKNIDSRLASGDRSLVGEIAKAKDATRSNYSFATKYCSHHYPELFPIYDRYVAEVLMFLHRKFPELVKFKNRDSLKDYETFVGAIEDVRQAFGLQDYNYKDIDRYLWQLGKDYYNPYAKQETYSDNLSIESN